MSFTLYQALVPGYLQILGATAGLVDKAQAWCAEQDVAPADLLDRRVAPDMLPLYFQLRSVVRHSLGAIEGAQRGRFLPPERGEPATDFTPLRDRIGAARDALEAIDPAVVNGFVGRDMVFAVGGRDIAFEAQDFLLSVAQPNFFFHATATYAILRGAGLPIGKLDFLGRVRVKPQ